MALLTADTYRIAAAEQLRTYANILEVPFRIIYSVEELSQAMRDFKDCDYNFSGYGRTFPPECRAEESDEGADSFCGWYS